MGGGFRTELFQQLQRKEENVLVGSVAGGEREQPRNPQRRRKRGAACGKDGSQGAGAGEQAGEGREERHRGERESRSGRRCLTQDRFPRGTRPGPAHHPYTRAVRRMAAPRRTPRSQPMRSCPGGWRRDAREEQHQEQGGQSLQGRSGHTQVCLTGEGQDPAICCLQDESFLSLQIHLGVRKSSRATSSSGGCFFCRDIPELTSEQQGNEATRPLLTLLLYDSLSKTTQYLVITSSGN